MILAEYRTQGPSEVDDPAKDRHPRAALKVTILANDRHPRAPLRNDLLLQIVTLGPL